MREVNNTENRHLRYWYDGDPNKIWRTSHYEYTTMSVGGCTRTPMSFRAELIRNARSIKRDFPDLTVFMSGGLDSEMALRSFLNAGITPKLVTVRFPDGDNMHDIGPMMEMLDQMGLSYTVIDFDMQEFVQSEKCYDIAKKYQAYTLYQQMLLSIAEDYAAPMITVDEIELEKIPSINWETGESTSKWVFLKKEDQDGVWRRFVDKTGIPALNNFYTYSPESILAFLKIPTTANLIRDRIQGKLGWTSSKMQIYSNLGYTFRKRPKWHGVENYIHLWDQVRYNVSMKAVDYTPRHYTIPALELEQNLINGTQSICNVV